MAEQTPSPTRETLLLVELKSRCHRDTIRSFFAGKPVREASAARIRAALEELEAERTPATTTGPA